jgi:hypothetical protein
MNPSVRTKQMQLIHMTTNSTSLICSTIDLKSKISNEDIQIKCSFFTRCLSLMNIVLSFQYLRFHCLNWHIFMLFSWDTRWYTHLYSSFIVVYSLGNKWTCFVQCYVIFLVEWQTNMCTSIDDVSRNLTYVHYWSTRIRTCHELIPSA